MEWNIFLVYVITLCSVKNVACGGIGMMLFSKSKSVLDTTGVDSEVVQAQSALHCMMKCQADVTCTSLSYGGAEDCRLLRSQLATEFATTNDGDATSWLADQKSCAEMKAMWGDGVTSGVNRFCSSDASIEGKILCYRAYCDHQTDGGGWTLIQRRLDGSVDFYRGWDEYKAGFGNVDGEYWIGLDLIHQLTAAEPTQLRVDLEDFEGNSTFALYSTFGVGDESSLYQLAVGGYQPASTAGESLLPHNGMSFTTMDADHDTWTGNCAVQFKGAWWYKGCHESNLNGDYKGGPHISHADGVNWKHFRGPYYSLKVTEMKIRPTDYNP